ncbi:hypothetical protein EII19_00675 [Comamonadaceae bacterium OH2310_COT-174]|nr:hypothetical protein EII19_00675 [Comamonadaceae bacterium OH2310_COT-174]
MTMQESISAAFGAVGGDIKELQGGVIVDSGQNDNGFWVRWADGTQMCRSPWIALLAKPALAAGQARELRGVGNAPVWVFPKPFIAAQPVTALCNCTNTCVGTIAGLRTQTINGQSWAVSMLEFKARNVTSDPVNHLSLQAIAWGRWK